MNPRACVVARQEILWETLQCLKDVVATDSDLVKFHHGSSPDASVDKIGIAFGSATTSSQLRSDLINLLHVGCGAIVLIWAGDEISWKRTGWGGVSGGLVFRCGGDIWSLRSAIEVAAGTTASSLLVQVGHTRLLRRLQAENLYDLIEDFVHNAPNDITNNFLAPARMLLVGRQTEAARSIWTSPGKDLLAIFKANVVDVVLKDNCRESYGDLGLEFASLAQTIASAFEGDPDVIDAGAAVALSRLMEALAECRFLAGRKIESSALNTVPRKAPGNTGQPRGPAMRASASQARRLLVIDDDIACWRSVLRSVQDVLREKHGLYDIEINVATSFIGQIETLDESNLALSANASASLPDYDLLLLDIYLGLTTRTGVEWLEDIRGRMPQIPIILWTTSTDRELPAQAALANGYLFKKLATIDEIADVIARWLGVGHGQRLWSLPHPYFDSAIKDPDLREIALSWTRWTLRYMDSFHAIDDFFFRYFNDHGGRHILGLMDVMSRLLRPFLLGHDDRRILSVDAPTRQHQVLSIYLATLCHEYGMFPILRGEHTSDHREGHQDVAMAKRLQRMRRLHAIRGMMMLLADSQEAAGYDVRDLSCYLQGVDMGPGRVVRHAAAIMVGYHQRCLSLADSDEQSYLDAEKILSANSYSQSNKTPALDKLKIDHELCALRANNDPNAEDATHTSIFSSIADAWSVVSSADLWSVDSLRCVCALLRFADALDIDHTRVPAEFLLREQERRRARQDLEDVKRQVLHSVTIDGGRVSLHFYSRQPETAMEAKLQEFAKAVRDLQVLGTLGDGIDGADVEAFRGYTRTARAIDFELFSNPWSDPQNAGSLENLKSFLEDALFAFMINKRIGEPVDPGSSRGYLATAAALLVVLEVESEYKAIREVGLGDIIQLDQCKWSAESTGIPLLEP